MIASMAILGVFFYKKDFGDVSDLGWMPLSCLVVYVLSFSLGFGPVPWLMMGEILPAKIRGPAASVATGFNWSCTFVVTKGFTAIVGMLNFIFLYAHEVRYSFNFLTNGQSPISNFCFCRARKMVRCVLDIHRRLYSWLSLCYTEGARNTRQKS